MRIFVTPAPGKAVRQTFAPYQRVPAEGFYQDDSSAWRRLERSGDVLISSGPAETPRAAPASVVSEKAKK